MKSFIWIIALLLPVLARCCYADSIPIFTTQADISFTTNMSGDNQFSIFGAPGLSLDAGGDASSLWLVEDDFFLTPGSSLNPSIQYLDWVSVYGNVAIGGSDYGCGGENCVLFGTGLTALGSFTFPTNGHNFTVTVPAIIDGPITGEFYGETAQSFDLQIPPGKLVLTFDFEPGQNGAPSYYQFSQGEFTTQPTPEPGTLGLMASGLAGILSIGVKTRNRSRLPT